MGVLFVFFLFICVREHIAINTNENVSQLPVLNQQIQDASALSLRYSATEYIIPSHQNVLYTITPTLSKTTDGQRNSVPIAYQNCLIASSMRGPVEQSVCFQNNPEVCKEIHAVNNYAPTGCFSIDNAMYPIYMKEDLNNLKDIYSKYLPRPSLHIYNSPNAGLSYSSIDINEMDKDINQSMNAFYKEAMCNNMRQGLQNLQNEKCSENQVIQQSTQKTESERKPTTKSNISPENPQSLNRNNIDKTFLTNPLTRECDTLISKITPSINNYNGQFISEASCPSNPFIITDNNRNKDIVRSENIKEVNNNYQALQRNVYNSASIMCSPNTLTNNRDLLNLPNNQVPETCHLINTVKESITKPGCKRNHEPTQTLQSSNLQGQSNVQRNLNNPISGGLETPLQLNKENNSQKYNTIDNLEKHIIDKMPCYNEPRFLGQHVKNPFNGAVSNNYNLPKNEECTQFSNEKKLNNENNRICDTPKLSTGKIDSENLNNLLNNPQPNMELSMSNEDLQKQIEKIKQRYILAQSPIQSCTESKQKFETINNENKLPELNKFNDLSSTNSASHKQCYTKDNRNLISSVQSSTNYLPTLNNKTNHTLTTNYALNELKNSLDWLPNYMKLMNYNNVPLSIQEYTERGNKQFSFQDMKAINNEQNIANPNQSFKRIEKEPSFINRASNTLQNYDNYIPNNYKKEPLNLIQESSQKNYILPTSTRTINEDNQSYNLNQNICEIKTNPEQEARDIFTNLPKEFNLNNNYIRRDVPLVPALTSEPINNYANYLISNKIAQGLHTNNPSKAENLQGSTTQNAPRNLNPIYDANTDNTIRNKNDHYPVFSVPQYQIIEQQPKASSITIHPRPIQPTVIQRPGLCTDSAKPIISEQPQVYTRVTSNVFDSQYHNREQNLLCDSEVRTTQGNPCSSINSHNTEDLKYPKPSNFIESILSNTPISNDAITPNLSPKSFSNNPVMCNESPNDRYSSLISTSLNNIASVLFTNMLTSKKKIIDNNNSIGTSENSSTSPQISNTNLSLLPELSKASLDVPIFSVIPPCVESPRLLPDPFILENNTSSIRTSVSKTNKRSKSKNKSVDNKFISTITINVLPSVQQTSHEIVILI